MRVFFQPLQKDYCVNPSFNGKSEVFWKVYNKEMKGVPLKDTIIKSISDRANLLGEGLSKKGFNLVGLKDYVIRVYKDKFKKEDLKQEFQKPDKSHLNILEEVVLCIPEKIDIVKKKLGVGIGILNYAKRLHVHEKNPLENVGVTRAETLDSLKLYEQLKDFPLKSYKQAYLQLKKFCKQTGFQFDIISPNNILVDTKNKQINLIDPVTPDVNKGVHGDKVEFSELHGCDSLYPTLCDFLLQKDHLNNLNSEERQRWDDAINIIVAKCISAGKSVGLNRNIEKLRSLYANIDRFWNTNEICKRFDSFIDKYSSSIKEEEVLAIAVNHKNDEQVRINAINRINIPEFKYVKPTFDKILEAPHQPKVEFPEILNAVLDKISEYGKNAKSILPSLEVLFDKEIFYTTKKRIYNLFIELQPDNERFLAEMEKSAHNSFEKHLYHEEFEKLHNCTLAMMQESADKVNKLYENSLKGEKLPQYIVDKLWISRSCTNSGLAQEISLKNMFSAYEYIESKKNTKPKIEDLVTLHKIVMANVPKKEHIVGRLRTPETDDMIKQIFNIKKDTTNTVCDYSASKDVVSDLEKLEKYIDENFDKTDVFTLATYIYTELIRIHPFLDANGRTTRLFTEQFLLSKGYRLMKWPPETLYRKICSPEQITEALKNCSVKENQ